MGKEFLTFSNTDIGKKKFERHKSPVPLRDVDIEKVLESKKKSSGEKNTLFITYIMIIKLRDYV